MNADDLRKRLSMLVVPGPDPEVRDRALDAALRELQASSWRGMATVPLRRFSPKATFRTLAAAASIVLFAAAAIRLSIHRPADRQAGSLAVERAVLSQMEILFGPQLDAVIEGPDDAPTVCLAADPTAGGRAGLAQPVLVQFRRMDGGTVRVLSYSGRGVCVTIRGKRICFEPLVTGRDEVLLSGETFCWVPGQTSAAWNGYEVSAWPLPPS